LISRTVTVLVYTTAN